MSTETPVKNKKSKGQKFKEQFGISLTMHKNMKKQGLDSAIEGDLLLFRKNRNKWKNEQRKAQRAKADKAKAGKKVKVSTVKK